MATRPNIKLQSGIDNDIYALLNAQDGQSTVTIGDALRVQNKCGVNVYIHEGLESFEINGGTTCTINSQVCTTQGATGVIATCVIDGVINVEVI